MVNSKYRAPVAARWADFNLRQPIHKPTMTVLLVCDFGLGFLAGIGWADTEDQSGIDDFVPWKCIPASDDWQVEFPVILVPEVTHDLAFDLEAKAAAAEPAHAMR